MALVVAAAGSGASAGSDLAPLTPLVSCGDTRALALVAPLTGPLASFGVVQRNWFRFYIERYNAAHATTKFTANEGDTVLGGPAGTAAAVRAMEIIASDAGVLAVVGPAGSSEVEAITPTLKAADLTAVSSSATRTTLTRDGARQGFFFRTVPPDAQQSADVARYLVQVLRATTVAVVDDQQPYGTRLADDVQARLAAVGVTVTRESVGAEQSDFSALIAGIPAAAEVVYLPWIDPVRARIFGAQFRTARGAAPKLFGSDLLFGAEFASVAGTYVPYFPVNVDDPTVRAYARAHGGQGDYFGAPTYVAAQVVGGAIDRACADGTASRGEVRAEIERTSLESSVLGFPVSFDRDGDLVDGRFALYRGENGVFVPVGPPQPLGVVQRAWMTVLGSKRAVSRVHATKGLKANFRFSVLPVAGAQLQIRWSRDGRRIGSPVAVARVALVTSTISSDVGIAHGSYKAVLHVRRPGRTFVAVATARARVG